MAKKPSDLADAFRRIALTMPQAAESSHMGHPDFRAPGPKGKIFASLFCSGKEVIEEDCGMVKLTPQQQEDFIAEFPQAFKPIKGAWGLQGCTQVDLSIAKVPMLKRALKTAWTNLNITDCATQ